jgi:hypothetical protein
VQGSHLVVGRRRSLRREEFFGQAAQFAGDDARAVAGLEAPSRLSERRDVVPLGLRSARKFLHHDHTAERQSESVQRARIEGSEGGLGAVEGLPSI